MPSKFVVFARKMPDVGAEFLSLLQNQQNSGENLRVYKMDDSSQSGSHYKTISYIYRGNSN